MKFSGRSPAVVMAVTGLLLAIHGIVFAVPGTDECSDRCWEREYIISSPTVECITYNPASCFRCFTGNRCLDNFVGPTLPYCKESGTTTWRIYEAGCCQPRCTLPLNGNSEATDPSIDCVPVNQANTSRYVCSTTQ